MTAGNIILGEQKSYWSSTLHPAFERELKSLVNNHLNIGNMSTFDRFIVTNKLDTNINELYQTLVNCISDYSIIYHNVQEQAGYYLSLIIPRVINGNLIFYPETDYINASRRDQITQMWPADDLLIKHKEQYPNTSVYVVPYNFYYSKYQLVFHKALED